MCGILFSLCENNEGLDPEMWQTLKKLNTKRGPDGQREYRATLKRESNTASASLAFFSTVLHLRGPEIVLQPLYNDHQDVLCWNGEIFGGLHVPAGANDTQCLMDRLSSIQSAEKTNNDSNTLILNIFSQIEGPFAFVYWQARESKLWFGRDCLGRRSLLWRRSKGGLMLSSIGMPPQSSLEEDQNARTQDLDYEKELDWEEVPAIGIYCVQLENLTSTSDDDAGIVCRFPMRLFRWSHEPTKDTMLLPFNRINAILPKDDVTNPVIDELCDPIVTPDMNEAIIGFSAMLSAAVRDRVADIPYLQSSPGSARIAVLFSGGLDCICLAALAHTHLPSSESIDLINVAFENPRVEGAKQQTKMKDSLKESSINTSMYETPDRKTGKAGVAELRRIAPNRIWNFVEVNVPFHEAQTHRKEIIDRMYPLNTVMDLSIAMAFWFAARGKGVVNTVPYHSMARVLLSGLGADEQLGGYSRHREAYRQGGWKKLIEETQLDIDRISMRNLGRDDRIMSDHGKEVRFPFLCTNLVSQLCQLPIYLKMDMRYGRGVGEKILLRHVARKLGLLEASRNWKRAIQFGAKTAKMTATARSEKGQHKLV